MSSLIRWFFVTVLVAILWGRFQNNKKSQETCSDIPFFSLDGVTTDDVTLYYQPPSLLTTVRHKSLPRLSQYVPMSDGVRLAVDVYLPPSYHNNTQKSDDDDNNNNEERETPTKRFPTFLHLTRYRRAEKSSWMKYIPLFGEPTNTEGYLPIRSLQYIQALVPNGYALVTVDVRGTGASFGSRPVDLMDREVQDYNEVLNWVKQQPWCNGRIGTGGISYDGITGALMAANAKEKGGVQAVAMMFAPGDIFDDIAIPGGIMNVGFLNWYGRFTQASERNVLVKDPHNQLPTNFKLLSRFLFDGVMPVTGHEDELPLAIAEHYDNFDMLEGAKTIPTKDSAIIISHKGGQTYTAADLGITQQTYELLVRNQVAVYSFAGYYDSGSIRSAARLHNYMISHGGDSKLTIGPWSHGARASWTPNTTSTVPGYPIVHDVKRFFDCKLKDQCEPDMMSDEPSLHFFLSGIDEWRTGPDQWPPQEGLHTNIMVLSDMVVNDDDTSSRQDANASTTTTTTTNATQMIEYTVDFNATSGFVSRWNLVQHILKRPITYPDRAEQIKKSLGFHTTPLPYALQIVGSPHVVLSLQLNHGAWDTAIFVYLDAIDPLQGTVRYITEGSIRASHRPTKMKTTSNNNATSSTTNTSPPRIGAFDIVHRSYLKRDMQPLESEKSIQIEIVLEPVAYVIPQGHILRLGLAGADVDNYSLENIQGLATTWYIDAAKSELHLPVLKNPGG